MAVLLATMAVRRTAYLYHIFNLYIHFFFMIKIDRQNKIPKNYRLNPEVVRQIEKMAIDGHVSETYIVESAINDAWFHFVEQEKKQRILNL